MAGEGIAVFEANRTYKDSVFRDLFGSPERKRNALDLYNALNGTDYDDPDILEVTTIEDALCMGVRNDVSYLVNGDAEMLLWEHQSTPNPNMPVRGLIYFARLYGKYVGRLEDSKSKIHSRTLVPLPRASFVVFYNGKEDWPDHFVLRLSDAVGGGGCIELEATVLNINPGHNRQLLESCPALAGYVRLVELVREYHDIEGRSLVEAVDLAERRCTSEGHLVGYLKSRWEDVRNMFVWEFTLEEAQGWAEEARQRAEKAQQRAEEARQRADQLEKRMTEIESERAVLENERAVLESERAVLENERAETVRRLAALVASGELSVGSAAGVLGVTADEARKLMGL